MTASNISEIKRRLEISEKQIANLQNGYQSILDFIDEMEHLIQFQDKIDIPYNIEQIWNVFLNDIQNLIKVAIVLIFEITK